MEKKLKLDQSAPRYRPETTSVFTDSFFKQFFKENPQFKHYGEELGYKELRFALKRLNENLGQVAIDTRDGVMFPANLGILYLASTRRMNKRVNEKLSNELGYNINHMNNHSDGKSLLIIHSARPPFSRFENQTLFKFRPSHDLKDRASKAFSDKHHIYRPLEDSRVIQKRERSFYKRENIDPSDFKKYKRKK